MIGAVAIYHEVGPFADKEIAAIRPTFSAQAVIAIENTRLLNGRRKSLEQRTATADVLRASAVAR